MKVCVIGAGPSGLTTIKQLLDEGHDVQAFEQQENLGGIWYRRELNQHETKAYDNLILTISAKLMIFSDYMVEKKRIYYTQKQYLDYLAKYAEKFELRNYIAFNTKVTAVKRLKDCKWCVTVLSGGGSSSHLFDAIAICGGPFQTPNTSIEGLEKFTGNITHSANYRNNYSFTGKRVLVIGLAESGADILKEVSDVASHCTLSIRSHSFLVPRLYGGKYSTDTGSRALYYAAFTRTPGYPYVASALGVLRMLGLIIFMFLRDLMQIWKRDGKTHLPPLNNLGEPMFPKKIDIGTEWNEENIRIINTWNDRAWDRTRDGAEFPRVIFCKNVSFVPNISTGKIRVDDSGIQSVNGQSLTFKSGVTEEFDTIVLCTGFKRDFSTLGKDLAVDGNNVRNLYKHAFATKYDGRLAYIGYLRPLTGGVPVCAEMQARYFAQLCSDKLKLPADVNDQIAREKVWEEERTYLSSGHTEAIPSKILFMDSIAREIGCIPSVMQQLIRPWLFVKYWFYPFNQASYRLFGPHKLQTQAFDQLLSEEHGPLPSDGIVDFRTGRLAPPKAVRKRAQKKTCTDNGAESVR